jgi:hypothetical protein
MEMDLIINIYNEQTYHDYIFGFAKKILNEIIRISDIIKYCHLIKSFLKHNLNG